ncbi:MAG: ABC transporter permease [Bacteroidetes bacterium]|nr:ABC transporter permease [Bacteroidota bacterium]
MLKEKPVKKNNRFLKRFAHRRTVRLAAYFLLLIAVVASFANVLSNEKPLYVKYKGEHLFPALSLNGFADIVNNDSTNPQRLVYANVNWRELKKEKVIWCPIVFSPGKSDWINSPFKSPNDFQTYSENGKTSEANFRNRHWLGTTKTGADVLSGIIHGTRVSLTIGICSMIIAGLTGILLGAMAGFFGDHRIRISKSGFITGIILGLPLAWFYGVSVPLRYFGQMENTSFLSILAVLLFAVLLIAICLFITFFLGRLTGRFFKMSGQTFLHVDQFISRGIEIFNSIPRIVLIITLSAIARPSVINLVLIIGLTSWTDIARLVRAEMLKVRSAEYILSAEASGIKTIRQVYRHALPNVVIPAITAITLGIASAILTESALSFLGIGVPADVVTWGSLLNEGRQNFSAWWLVVFPGLAIFCTVTAFNIAGDALSESIDTTKR